MSLAILILTRNEEEHIERCIASVRSFAKEAFVVDSYSTDRTAKLAESAGAKVYRNSFVNHAAQLNWGLDNIPLATDWVMRLDADEYATPELADEIAASLDTLPDDVSGLYVTRRVYFMGKWIRHGGYYPTRLLRIWRRGRGRCEQRWMDEHIQLAAGRTITLRNDIVDDNRHGLTSWIDKHNHYATREAAEVLSARHGFAKLGGVEPKCFGTQEQRKRWVKERLYARLPLGLRAILYFTLRYFVRGGFLDGYPGLVFHVLQGSSRSNRRCVPRASTRRRFSPETTASISTDRRTQGKLASINSEQIGIPAPAAEATEPPRFAWRPPLTKRVASKASAHDRESRQGRDRPR